MTGTGSSAIAKRTSARGSDGNGHSRWVMVAGLIRLMPITAELDRGANSLTALVTQSTAIHATSTIPDFGIDRPPTTRPGCPMNPRELSHDIPKTFLPRARPTRAILPRRIRNRHPIGTRRIMDNTKARRRRVLAALPACDMTPLPTGRDSGPSIHSTRHPRHISSRSLRTTCTNTSLRTALGRKNIRALHMGPLMPKLPTSPLGVDRPRTPRRTTCRIGAIWPCRR